MSMTPHALHLAAINRAQLSGFHVLAAALLAFYRIQYPPTIIRQR